LQTSHQISAKSVNICNSYSKFSRLRSLKSISAVPTIGRGVIDSQVCVRANGRTSAHLISVFKMSTVCSKSNASSKMWTPLPDRFIDDHLVEMFPQSHSSIRRDFIWSTLRIWLRYTRYCSFPKSGS